MRSQRTGSSGAARVCSQMQPPPPPLGNEEGATRQAARRLATLSGNICQLFLPCARLSGDETPNTTTGTHREAQRETPKDRKSSVKVYVFIDFMFASRTPHTTLCNSKGKEQCSFPAIRGTWTESCFITNWLNNEHHKVRGAELHLITGRFY